MRLHVNMTALVGVLALSLWGAAAPAAGPLGEITREELQALLAGGAAPLVLDVRAPEEYAVGHIPGAINIPHDQAAARLEELRSYRDREIVLYCKSGRRAGIAADVLAQAGFSRLRHLAGDMPGWSAQGLPVEQTPVNSSP
jgi:phage shock protein E